MAPGGRAEPQEEALAEVPDGLESSQGDGREDGLHRQGRGRRGGGGGGSTHIQSIGQSKGVAVIEPLSL